MQCDFAKVFSFIVAAEFNLFKLYIYLKAIRGGGSGVIFANDAEMKVPIPGVLTLLSCH